VELNASEIKEMVTKETVTNVFMKKLFGKQLLAVTMVFYLRTLGNICP
jgi:hypothetical protein